MRDRLSWLSLAMALACAPVSADETTVPEIRPGVLQGYLSKEALPDSAALLPPPPAVGSAAAALDQEVAKANLAFRDTLRWRLAAMDANLQFPEAAGDFSCALGAPVTVEDTPRLYQMLRRVGTDAGFATFAAKDKYQHARPFMLDGQPICTPETEQRLRQQGSYPSGHTSIGWAWALVLAEASPDEAQAILGARPRFRRKPARLQRPLGKRCDRGPLHRRGDRGAAACRTAIPRRSRRRQGRTRGGARQASPSATGLQFRGGGAGRDAAAVALSAFLLKPARDPAAFRPLKLSSSRWAATEIT